MLINVIPRNVSLQNLQSFDPIVITRSVNFL